MGPWLQRKKFILSPGFFIFRKVNCECIRSFPEEVGTLDHTEFGKRFPQGNVVLSEEIHQMSLFLEY